MRPVKIIYHPPRMHKTTIFALLYSNFELYRIYHGIHPWISPRLAEAGLFTQETAVEKQTQERRLQEKGTRDGEKKEDDWVVLNGVPIPSYDWLVRPFRRD